MTKDELLADLPPLFAEDLLPKIHNLLIESKRTLVVLDDDPMGTQTVFDVPVLTDLSDQVIRDAIDEAPPVLFILTNSRALTTEETIILHARLGKVLGEFDEDVIVISRSDAALRGHFPQEVDPLREGLGLPQAPVLFIPFCEASGCMTIDDRHYLIEGEVATLIHETHFTQDEAILCSQSHLPAYLEKKIGSLSGIESLSVSDLRSGDVSQKLEELPEGCICIVNAASLKDLDVLSLALHQSKRRFLIRSAASFVQSMAGIVSRPTLDPWQLQDLEENSNGGLIIVGSTFSKTNAQLNHLLATAPEVVPLEVDVAALLKQPDEVLFPLSVKLNETIDAGQTVALFTSRERVEAEGQDVLISQAISRALVSLVQSVVSRPAFLIAKGGSTASEIATDALGVKMGHVLGQILPGVPVWTLGHETRHPGLMYVVFPGATQGVEALVEAYWKLKG